MGLRLMWQSALTSCDQSEIKRLPTHLQHRLEARAMSNLLCSTKKIARQF